MGSSLDKPISSTSKSSNVYDQFIDEAVRSNRILVFSKTNCSYCTRAKSLLKNMNLEYQAIELDRNEECPESNCQYLIKSLIYQTRIRTVPQIFINGQLIGGFTDLESLTRDPERFQQILREIKK